MMQHNCHIITSTCNTSNRSIIPILNILIIHHISCRKSHTPLLQESSFYPHRVDLETLLLISYSPHNILLVESIIVITNNNNDDDHSIWDHCHLHKCNTIVTTIVHIISCHKPHPCHHHILPSLQETIQVSQTLCVVNTMIMGEDVPHETLPVESTATKIIIVVVVGVGVVRAQRSIKEY